MVLEITAVDKGAEWSLWKVPTEEMQEKSIVF